MNELNSYPSYRDITWVYAVEVRFINSEACTDMSIACKAIEFIPCGLIRYQCEYYYDVGNTDYTK